MSLPAMTPIRHVFMSTDAAGGVWTYALELARGLSKYGCNVTLCILGPSPSREQARAAATMPSLDVITTGLPLDWTASGPQQLDDVAAELQHYAAFCDADIVHLNAPGHGGRTQWTKPLVVSCHSCVATWWRAQFSDELPADLRWRRERTADGLDLADAIIVPSAAFARSLEQEYGLKPHLTVVHNGRAMPHLIATQPTNILTAGRLWDPAKNVALIDEAACLAKQVIRAAGPVDGPNGEHTQLKNLKLLGSLGPAELSAEYAHASIFVSVPLYEPFGLSVLEAAQHGCALVLSGIPTLRELWDGAALFINPQNAKDLAGALTRLAGDPALRHTLAGRARHTARRYSTDRMLSRTLDVYQAAIGEHSAPSFDALVT